MIMNGVAVSRHSSPLLLSSVSGAADASIIMDSYMSKNWTFMPVFSLSNIARRMGTGVVARSFEVKNWRVSSHAFMFGILFGKVLQAFVTLSPSSDRPVW